MTAATHRSAEPRTGGPVTEASAAETRSLDELAARLARLPGNTDPEQTALISKWVGEAADQFSNAPIQAFVPILVEHIVRAYRLLAIDGAPGSINVAHRVLPLR